MMSTLEVIVQDPEFNHIEKAAVSVAARAREEHRQLEYDDRRERFVAIDLEAGVYDLEVHGPEGLASVDRTVEIESETERVVATLGPEGMPHYLAADGERVYFQPDRDVALLFIHGQRAHEALTDVREAFDLDVVALPPPEDQVANVGRERPAELNEEVDPAFAIEEPDPLGGPGPDDEVTVRVDLTTSEESRAELLEALQDALTERADHYGLRTRLAVPLRRGGDEQPVLEGLTDELLVRFDGSVTEPEARELASEYECELVRSITFAENAYLWRYKGPPDYELVDRVHDLTTKESVRYAEPNVVHRIMWDGYTPSDYLYTEQSHWGVINVEDAWDALDDLNTDLRFGSPNITVGVMDQGVGTNHPELTGTLTDGSNKLVASYDFNNMNQQRRGPLEYRPHGHKSASSAVARTDGTAGVSGVAGNCGLVAGRIPSTLTGLEIAEAWIWMAGFHVSNPKYSNPPSEGADVISNSWGVYGAALSNVIRDALDFLTVYGRDGRGCVVCFSVGNLGHQQFSTVRRYAAYERTIAVGASISANPTDPVPDTTFDDPTKSSNPSTNVPVDVDERALYSPYGPELDLVAPSHTAYDPSDGLVDPIPAADTRDHGPWIGDDATRTTLAKDVSPGDRSIKLTDPSGFGISQGAYTDAVQLGALGAPDQEFVYQLNRVHDEIRVIDVENTHSKGDVVAKGPNNYTGEFGGTSHACPTVAGAAALVLSAAPELTWIQARDMLRETADRIDTGQTHSKGQWVDNDNDGIAEFSQWYGYGRLDLHDAVTTAIGYSTNQAPDVIVRDNLQDTGSVPSPGWHASSPDLWVRRDDDPIPSLSYGSSPAHETPLRGQDNYVYMRVKNVGTVESPKVYLRAMITHFPGFEFQYPEAWRPDTRPGQAIPSPLEPGSYLIGETQITDLAPGADTIVKMRWDRDLVPPETVTVNRTTVQWHPCLLAEVSPHDGPKPSGKTGYPVRHDNNLAQRNIEVKNQARTNAGVAVMAGTVSSYDVESLILDRSRLKESHRVIFQVPNEERMDAILERLAAGDIVRAEPLPSSTNPSWDRARGIEETTEPTVSTERFRLSLQSEAHIAVSGESGQGFRFDLPEGSEITSLLQPVTPAEPQVSETEYEGRPALAFDGGADAIRIPFRLREGTYQPVILDIAGPGEPAGLLKATQRLSNGDHSAGFSIGR